LVSDRGICHELRIGSCWDGVVTVLGYVMGKTEGPYNEEFPKGYRVKIADRAFLENFFRTWEFHHKLEPDQLKFAGKIAKVKSVGFYHRGDVLTNSRECRAAGTNNV